MCCKGRRKGTMKPTLRIVVAAVVALLVGPITQLASQSLRIALNLTEHGSCVVVTSQLSAALRSLGDVVVVTTAESHDYRLDGVVLCSPSDERCETFAVALNLSEPFNPVSGTQVLDAA